MIRTTPTSRLAGTLLAMSLVASPLVASHAIAQEAIMLETIGAVRMITPDELRRRTAPSSQPAPQAAREPALQQHAAVAE